MKLEDQVVSFSLARRLKELGVKQDCVYYWVGREPDVPYSLTRLDFIDVQRIEKDDPTHCLCISAFTVAELGEMLPDEIVEEGVTHALVIEKTMEGWGVDYLGGMYEPMESSCVDGQKEDTTEADARAKMLIYLIEKGVVKP